MILGYYGIMPKEVRHSKKITSGQKLIYTEITCCLNEDGVCTKPNAYFARVLNFSIGNVSNSIKALRESGFIKVIIENEVGTNKFLKRYIAITPTDKSLGVLKNLDFTYADKNEGVRVNAPRLNGSTPSDKNGTLLHSNNNIYISSVKKNKIKMDRAIKDEELEFIKPILNEFYETQSTRFPNMVSPDWKSDLNLFNGSVNTIYQLIKKDKVDYRIIKKVIQWAVRDPFWSKVLFSLRTLRDKSSNGMSKYANLEHRYLNG